MHLQSTLHLQSMLHLQARNVASETSEIFYLPPGPLRGQSGSHYQPASAWRYHPISRIVLPTRIALYYQSVLPWYYYPQCEPGVPNSVRVAHFITGLRVPHRTLVFDTAIEAGTERES